MKKFILRLTFLKASLKFIVYVTTHPVAWTEQVFVDRFRSFSRWSLLGVFLAVTATCPLMAEPQLRESEASDHKRQIRIEGGETSIVISDKETLTFKLSSADNCAESFCRYDVFLNESKIFSLPMKAGQILSYGNNPPFYLPSSKPLKFNFSVGGHASDEKAEYSVYIEYQVGVDNKKPDCLMPTNLLEILPRKNADPIGDVLLSSPTSDSCLFVQFAGNIQKISREEKHDN